MAQTLVMMLEKPKDQPTPSKVLFRLFWPTRRGNQQSPTMGVPTLEGSPPKEPGYSALGLLLLGPTTSTLEPGQSLPQASQEEGRQGAGFLTLGQSHLFWASTYQGVSHWLLGEARPWEAPKVTVGAIQSRVGKAATEGPPRGVVCRYSSRWGAGALGRCSLLSASVDTLCPGQSPFQNASQGSWRMLWEFWPCLKWGKGETLAGTALSDVGKDPGSF